MPHKTVKDFTKAPEIRSIILSNKQSHILVKWDNKYIILFSYKDNPTCYFSEDGDLEYDAQTDTLTYLGMVEIKYFSKRDAKGLKVSL